MQPQAHVVKSECLLLKPLSAIQRLGLACCKLLFIATFSKVAEYVVMGHIFPRLHEHNQPLLSAWMALTRNQAMQIIHSLLVPLLIGLWFDLIVTLHVFSSVLGFYPCMLTDNRPFNSAAQPTVLLQRSLYSSIGLSIHPAVMLVADALGAVDHLVGVRLGTLTSSLPAPFSSQKQARRHLRHSISVRGGPLLKLSLAVATVASLLFGQIVFHSSMQYLEEQEVQIGASSSTPCALTVHSMVVIDAMTTPPEQLYSMLYFHRALVERVQTSAVANKSAPAAQVGMIQFTRYGPLLDTPLTSPGVFLDTAPVTSSILPQFPPLTQILKASSPPLLEERAWLAIRSAVRQLQRKKEGRMRVAGAVIVFSSQSSLFSTSSSRLATDTRLLAEQLDIPISFLNANVQLSALTGVAKNLCPEKKGLIF